MASRIKEIGTVCRFCLCKEGLIAMSDAIGSVFAAEDVLYYTGIQISEKEELPYAICHVCCKVIRNSVRFRSTCLKNDTIIKKLLSLLKAEKSTNVPFEYPAPSMGTFGGNTPRSNTETITLDESDSDDSPPSLHGEAMQEASNDIAPSVENGQRITSSTTEKESVDHGGCVENEKSTSNEMMNQNDESVDLMSKDDSDSDSSLPSLYGESMVPPVKNDSFIKDANEGKEMCHLCGTFQRYFYNHMKRVHQKKHTFSCPYCPKQLSERYHLKDHINTWHKKHIKFTCPHCGKGYTNYDGYFYHLENSHGKSNSYECETCHKKWKSIDSYRKHRRTHSVTAITCKDCGRIYKNNVTFEQHLLQYHPT
ncbi:zinc finger protein 16-like isoform X2 [Anopheles ziemanni]|uniref:zinc finger protein 16-like n=1 Tax=Anopheles coustani TaxID=139045 RepID=UPI00265B6384|nr:zinc finger protein 16-like [Anopheles coustani]XP_058166193.1 zinc finger protein 16-like isoform X1 [Anopheles ziemanni]XP_058166194.1 zinc finger protein 16-like isoform X2 [Anopheles ziemanni]